MRSVALVVPADLQGAANALACALGHDTPPGHTYTIGLSLGGVAPATHYGTHTWARDAFVTMLLQAKQGIEVPGLTGVEALQVIAAVEVELGDEPEATWQAILTRLGLRVISDE